MQIAIYNRNFEQEDISLFRQLIAICEEREIKLFIYKKLADCLSENDLLPLDFQIFTDESFFSESIDFLLSLGGDGTMLDSICHVGNKKIPILGINLGNLGFLSDTLQSELEFAMDCLERDKFNVDHRSLLHLDANREIFGDSPFALNDFSIQRKDSSSLVKVDAYLNGTFLCTYLGDGLIISTPTGSTGYNLSCGGPIIAPQTSSFIITPVAPHNLNIRPIVISDDTIVSLEVEGRAKEFLCTLDARNASIDSSVKLAISKETFPALLVRLPGHDFINTLRQKLYWGVDRRH
jgi:NAD+ kinase